MRRKSPYIYDLPSWPEFTWSHEELMPMLARVRNEQGRITGKMESLGFGLREEAHLENLSLDVVKTSEIEGELLDPAQVRSSVARHLGMNLKGLIPSDRNVDGVVEMMMDATQNYRKSLGRERLFGWHQALFPEISKSLNPISIGKWRKDETGGMQVVSGPMGRERIHFQAPEASLLEAETGKFLKWFNGKDNLDPVMKAAIAHLWFVTLHPFDDGNGRIARAIADMQLARADGSAQRFYSMSARIRKERKSYYEILEKTQKGTLDITGWISWFLNCLSATVLSTDEVLKNVLAKAAFWEKHAHASLNERQRKMINRIFDGFKGNLTSSKWAKMNACSPDTALRDIHDLIEKKVLVKKDAGGRSTHYEVVIPEKGSSLYS